MSTLDPNVGWDPVQPAWANVSAKGREKIVIPWAEDDPGLAGPEFWSGRILAHAQEAEDYGATGLLLVHWRTSELSTQFAALTTASWSSTIPSSAEFVYRAWCRTNFGEAVGDKAAQLLLALDSYTDGNAPRNATRLYPATATKLPRVSQSCCGKFSPCFSMFPHCKEDACPGTSGKNASSCPAPAFVFVAAWQALEKHVVGAANKARFHVQLMSLVYFKQLVEAEAAATAVGLAVSKIIAPNATAAAKKKLALEVALPALDFLSRSWENMTTSLQQTVMSAGTLGTLATNDANQFVRGFPFNATYFLLKGLLPPQMAARLAAAMPSKSYLGPARLFVRTRRSVVEAAEKVLTVNATVLARPKDLASRDVTLFWRLLKDGAADAQSWPHQVAMRKLRPTSGVFSAAIPLGAASADFEYFVQSPQAWPTPEGPALVFPPGMADDNETITVVVKTDDGAARGLKAAAVDDAWCELGRVHHSGMRRNEAGLSFRLRNHCKLDGERRHWGALELFSCRS